MSLVLGIIFFFLWVRIKGMFEGEERKKNLFNLWLFYVLLDIIIIRFINLSGKVI